MPANLPREAKAKWAKVLEARRPEEKLKALEEFYSAIPKHKGTENLRRQITRKIAKLREEIELRRRKAAGKPVGPRFFVEKEDHPQIVLLGLPKSGKSSVVKVLTNAKTDVSDAPFTTKIPIPGTFKYQDVFFQLVDTPSLTGPWDSRVLALARNADGLLLVLDGTRPLLEQYETLARLLEDAGIRLEKPRARVEIQRRALGGRLQIVLLGRLVDCTLKDVEDLLRSYSLHSALVRIAGEATLDDIEDAIFENVVYKPAVLLVNKVDVKGVLEKAVELKKALGDKHPVVPFSAKKLVPKAVELLGRSLLEKLEVIRVYTKEPNKDQPSPKPMVVPRNTTVIEIARRIHSSLYKNFKYAKIWGPSAKYPGERVGGDHVLKDGDIVEIHSR